MDMTVSGNYDQTLQDVKHRLEAMKRAQKASQKKKEKKRKKVEYDAHEIATLLARATHSMGVGEILVKANSKLQQLQLCVGNGEYDINELRAAIAHAKRMVKCVRKKMRNLQEEEQMENKGKRKKASVPSNKERQARQKLERELNRLRRRHRGDEKKDMEEARRCYYRERMNAEREMDAFSYEPTAGGGGIVSASEAPAAEDSVAEAAPVDAGAVSVDVCL